jgi:hypothetical protein
MSEWKVAAVIYSAATTDKLLHNLLVIAAERNAWIRATALITTVRKPEAISNRNEEAIVALRGDELF